MSGILEKLTNIKPVEFPPPEIKKAPRKTPKKALAASVIVKKDNNVKVDLPAIDKVEGLKAAGDLPVSKPKKKMGRPKGKPVSEAERAGRRIAGKKSGESRRKRSEFLSNLNKKMDSRLDDDSLVDRISNRLFEKMSGFGKKQSSAVSPAISKAQPLPDPSPKKTLRTPERAKPAASSPAPVKVAQKPREETPLQRRNRMRKQLLGR